MTKDKFTCLLVGGAVRDHLLGIESKDRDYVVVGSSPGEMLAKGFTRVGAAFPVFLHPETNEEYALARTETKTGKGYHGFMTNFDSTVTLEEDLARRDLTINSMAMTSNFQVLDPFNGIEDLAAGVLRHTSEAFAEDSLRVLRMARFAARYQFKVAPETMVLSKWLVETGELNHLSRERVWTEMYKGFSEKAPVLMLMVLQDVSAMNTSPMVDYFGYDYNLDMVRDQLEAATRVKTSVNRTDANVLFAMPALYYSKSDMKVPKFYKDASRLEYLLTDVMTNMTADNVHKFLTMTRFVTECDSPAFELATFVSKVKAVVRNDEAMWRKNRSTLISVSNAIKKLNLAAVVAKSEKTKVKENVDAAKFAVVKRRFK